MQWNSKPLSSKETHERLRELATKYKCSEMTLSMHAKTERRDKFCDSVEFFILHIICCCLDSGEKEKQRFQATLSGNQS